MTVDVVRVSGDEALRQGCEAVLLSALDSDTGMIVPDPVLEAEVLAVRPGFPPAVVVAATVGGRVVGAGVVQAFPDVFDQIALGGGLDAAVRYVRRWRVMTHLAVAFDFRGQGVGSSVLLGLEQEAVAGGARGFYGMAEVREGVPSAPFYERHGYTVLAEGQELPPLGGMEARVGGFQEGQVFWKRL